MTSFVTQPESAWESVRPDVGIREAIATKLRRFALNSLEIWALIRINCELGLTSAGPDGFRAGRTVAVDPVRPRVAETPAESPLWHYRQTGALRTIRHPGLRRPASRCLQVPWRWANMCRYRMSMRRPAGRRIDLSLFTFSIGFCCRCGKRRPREPPCQRFPPTQCADGCALKSGVSCPIDSNKSGLITGG